MQEDKHTVNDDLIKSINDLEEQIKKAQSKPSKKNHKTLSIASIVGCFICIILSFVLTNSTPQISIFLVLIAIALLALAIWSGLRNIFSDKGKIQTVNTLQKQLDALLVIDEKSIIFYQECSKMIENGNKITEVLSVIGQKYGYSELSTAQTLFKKGEQEIQKQKIVDKYNKEKAQKDKMLRLHIKEQDDARIKSNERFKLGKEKYTVILKKWMDLIESQLSVAKNMYTISSSNANYRAKTSSWGIAGGIGSALGGPGLGLAAAIDTQAKNERERERALEKRALSKTQSSIAFDIEYDANKEKEKASKYIKAMDEVIIDQQNVDVKFKLLTFSNVRISLTKGGNLSVKFKLKCLAKPMILSKPAIFDGVLKLSIYDENKLISTGYYVANGYGEYNYQNAGFKMEDNINVICSIDSVVNVDKLRCEISPESLWFIEESKTIFKVDNSKIREAYKNYEETYNQQAKTVILNM